MAAYYNDFDPFCCEWIRNLIKEGLIPDGQVDNRSIADVKRSDLEGFTQAHFFCGIAGWLWALRLAGWDADRPVWTGSCPCQPLSCAGNRGGEKDERHLWPEFYRLISECRPATVFGEQVASKDGLEWLDGISLDLEELGYAVGSSDLPAAGVGAPHIRQRVFWVAHASSTTSERRTGGLPAAQTGIGSSGKLDGDMPERLADGGEDGRLAHTERPESGLREPGEQGRSPEQRRDRSAIDGTVGGLADLRGDGPQGAEYGDADGNGDSECQSRECVRGVAGQRSDRDCACLEKSAQDAIFRNSGMGIPDSAGPQPGRESTEDNRYRSAAESAGCWSDFLLIPCRDNKVRRISAEPGIFRMADGISASVGRLQSRLCGVDTSAECDSNGGQIDANAEEAGASEGVQALRSSHEPQEIQRCSGGPCGIQEASLLRPPVHESCDGRQDQGAERQELPPTVVQAGEGCLRGVRGDGPTIARPPQGREWAEQRRRQFDYVVRTLPSSLALAILHGYGPEAEALSALREAIAEKGTVWDAPATPEEIWRSLPDEEKDSIRLRFDASACVIIPREPLSAGIPRDVGRMFPGLAGMAKAARRNRVGRLKGYGNAIVSEVAAEFVRATQMALFATEISETSREGIPANGR